MDLDPREFLVAALRDENRIVAARAAQLLGQLRCADATAALIEYVTECRDHCKTTGFAALAAIGDRSACEAIRPLVDAPNVEDDWYWIGCKGVRAAAAVALLALGDDAGASHLSDLADAGEDVFFAWFAPAILTLPDELDATAALKGRITADACLGGGIRKARLTDPGAVIWVVRTLGILADPPSQARLRELLAWRSRYVRGQAAMSLMAAAAGDVNTAAVADLLTGDPTDFVQIRSALALSLAGHPHADAIAAMVESAADPFDQAAAVESLGMLGAADDAGVVAAQLTHADAYVRRCAVEALGQIRPADAASMAAPLADDTDPFVRLQVAKVLAEGGAA